MPGERTIGSRCCVASCLNYQLTSSGVVFHKFPRDSARLIVWTDIVCRWNSGKPWSPNSRTMICSDHFMPECYQRDLRLLCDAGFSTKYARLKPNAPDAVSSYLAPQSSPPQTADGSCVKRRRTGVRIFLAHNSADVTQQLRQLCSTPAEDETPSPLSLERDATPEPSEPGASPSDTSYTEADFVDPDLLDESYRPDNAFNSDNEPDSSDRVCSTSSAAVEPIKERKYLVTASQLLLLFSVCVNWLAPTRTKLTHRGTLVHAVITCARGHKPVWENQPRINSKALLKILLPAAIIYSGAYPTRVLRLLGSLGVQVLKKTQFFRVKSCLVFPAATKTWEAEQKSLLTATKDKLHLAGDGRDDSPGYSAKYGTSTLLDTRINKIMHYEVLQSTEVKSSNHIETEGLKRSLDFLLSMGLSVYVLVTDRHFGVNALMRDRYPDTKHRFDPWHVAKGNMKTVRGHVYWCAQTSSDNGALVLAKWVSVMRHVSNIHQHPSPLYPVCTHGPIEERWWLLESKKDLWTEPYLALEKIAMSKQLLKDIPRVSGDGQTYRLESFHSMLLRFTPKSSHFSFEGMVARTAAAVLHYNENSNRAQATTKDEKKRSCLKFPKSRKGEWVLSPIMETASNANGPRPRRPPLCSVAQRPDKQAAVLAHWTRFDQA
ncbi:hypothetical protein HPB47_018899 [Ixodes persulcatus]|uniref:Uncharacterized protein n=1 Tax=Ixodes persulcatus TaxID=34615 RepID=A0AC60QJR8_IXOPE|nr:hypothetical protein HPB47_018899 [Ixodes persulcatus]